jgi:hypothetical protein
MRTAYLFYKDDWYKKCKPTEAGLENKALVVGCMAHDSERELEECPTLIQNHSFIC